MLPSQFNHPLENPVGLPIKRYSYRFCQETFGGPVDTTTDGRNLRIAWREMVEHALDQWESATDNLVTMALVSQTCADYEAAIQAIVTAEAYLSFVNEPITTDSVRNYVTGLAFHADFISQDRRQNDVILVDAPRFTMLGNSLGVVFSELAFELGVHECVFGSPACAPRYVYVEELDTPIGKRQLTFQTTDILLRKRNGVFDPKIPTVAFNYFQTNMTREYEILVHEAGHALGIRNGSDGDGQLVHHPTIAGSVMSYENSDLPDGSRLPNDPDCSPHPLDIMVIHAIYQTY